MESMEAHVGKMDARFKAWAAQMDKYFAKADVAGAEVKADYQHNVDDLKVKYQITQAKFDALKAAGNVKWEIFKSDLDSACDELENAFKKLTQ